MSDNNKMRRGGKGYYIALILCAAAVGITSYVYYRNSNVHEETLLQETTQIPVGTMAMEADIPVLATQPQTEATQSAPTEQTVPQPVQKPKRKIQLPVSGQEIYGYSMETLSYNETTRDWRVHNGVDYAAEEGTPVCAAADGTVYTTYEDDAMGYTVVISHEGGYTTKYASLSADLPVSAGESVEAGQTIGYVGSSALVETTLGSHLHFSVTSQGKPMDPMAFFALGE